MSNETSKFLYELHYFLLAHGFTKAAMDVAIHLNEQTGDDE